MIPLFSLAGVPPLSGFIGKLALIRATLDAGAWWTSGIILASHKLPIRDDLAAIAIFLNDHLRNSTTTGRDVTLLSHEHPHR